MSVKRNIVHTLFTRVLVTGLMVLQSAFVTRLMGAEGRGLYAKLQAGLNFFILFLGLGLSSGIIHYIANRKHSGEKIMGVSLWLWFANLIFLGLFLWVCRLFPSQDLIFPNGYRLPFYLLYFFCSYAFTSLQIFLSSALSGRQCFPFVNFLESMTTLLRVVVFGAFFASTYLGFATPSLAALFFADLCLSAVRTVAFAIGYVREFGPRVSLFGQLREVATDVIGFSLLVYFSFLLNFFYLRMDYWLIERQLGLTELGIYSVAATLAQFITFIPMTLNTVMLPHLSASDPSHTVAQFRKFSKVNVMSCGALALFFVTCGSPLITILYGQAFAGSVIPLALLAIAFLLLSIKHLFAFYNIVQKRTRYNIWAEVLGLGVGLCLNLILIPRIGTIGAAVAAVGANLVSCTYLTSNVLMHLGVGVPGFFVLSLSDCKTIYQEIFRMRGERTV